MRLVRVGQYAGLFGRATTGPDGQTSIPTYGPGMPRPTLAGPRSPYGPAAQFQVPYMVELIDPVLGRVAGGNVMNRDTATYLFNLWSNQCRPTCPWGSQLRQGAELLMWKYSGNYQNPREPRSIERRAQLQLSNGSWTWQSLSWAFCTQIYCPQY